MEVVGATIEKAGVSDFNASMATVPSPPRKKTTKDMDDMDDMDDDDGADIHEEMSSMSFALEEEEHVAPANAATTKSKPVITPKPIVVWSEPTKSPAPTSRKKGNKKKNQPILRESPDSSSINDDDSGTTTSSIDKLGNKFQQTKLK